MICSICLLDLYETRPRPCLIHCRVFTLLPLPVHYVQRFDANRHNAPLLQAHEPGVFDDDELLDAQPEDTAKNSYENTSTDDRSLDDDDSLDIRFSTHHPSGKKRFMELSKPKVMEEAMTRFSEAKQMSRE
ncbi:hypothetical protein OROHE_019153 [Orobanche hederae]